jgi:hypothetical protein
VRANVLKASALSGLRRGNVLPGNVQLVRRGSVRPGKVPKAGPKVRRKAGPKVGRQGDDEDEEPLVVATSVDDIHVNMPWAIFERWDQYREMSPAQQRAAYATDGRDLHAAPVVYLHGAYHQTWYDGNGDPSVKVYSAAGWGAHLASLAEDRRDARVLQCSRRSTSPSY